MSNNLKHYNCTMTVLGPVHIGSGEKYIRNEYVFNDQDNSISVLDIGKAYQWFIDEGKEAEFESYYAEFSPRSLSLGDWFKSRRITQSTYSQWIKYKMTAGDSVVIFKGRNPKYSDILSFVKDPYFLPYVPGTSIKGMLRTALAMYEISKSESSNELLDIICDELEKYDKIKSDREKAKFRKDNKRKFLQNEAKMIESKLLVLPFFWGLTFKSN